MNTARLVLCVTLACASGGCINRGPTRPASGTPAATSTEVSTPKPSDRQLAKQLVGTWQGVEPSTGKVSLETRYAADGTLTGWFWNHEKTVAGAPTDVKVTVNARWEVAEGKIRVTACVTEPAGRLPASYASAEIVAVDANELVLRSSEDGALYRRRRTSAGGRN